MMQGNGADRQLTEELREFFLAKGADLVGFGSVGLMEGAPDIMTHIPHLRLKVRRAFGGMLSN